MNTKEAIKILKHELKHPWHIDFPGTMEAKKLSLEALEEKLEKEKGG